MSDLDRRTYGAQWTFVQECGKRGHVTRASAKFHRKSLRNAGTLVREYECDKCGFWHVGHLPHAVRRGYVSDVKFYDR